MGMAISILRKFSLLHGIIFLTLGGCKSAFSPFPVKGSSPSISRSTAENQVLYEIPKQPLKDSKWGKIAELRRKLHQALKQCGKPAIPTNGMLDARIQDALQSLAECPQIPSALREMLVRSPQRIDALFWKIFVQTPLPRVHERAFVLSLSHEATDYDRAEWNFGTSDDRSGLTWGPYGATIGHGNEIRGILKRVNESRPEILKKTFKNDYKILLEILNAQPSEGYALLKKNVFSHPEKKRFWKEAFQELADFSEVRQAYEAYALQTNAWLKPALQRLYTLVPPGQATEIDYAFFLDLAMHMSITRSRIQETRAALESKERELKRSLSPAQRRQVISLTLVPHQRRQDRLGRNVVYYIDGIPATLLSPQEREAWTKRSRLKASFVGLNDERRYEF